MTDERRAVAEDLSTVLPIITTEHFNLQTVRAASTSEAVGRASMYLATVSTALLALSFAGQVTQFDERFALFGAVTFLSLFFLGSVTFDRTLQVSIEDIQAAQRMNRLRRLYFELSPGLAGYLAPPSESDDVASVLRTGGVQVSRMQLLLTVAGMVSVMNSIVVAVLVGGLVHELAPGPDWLPVVLGAVTFLGAVGVHLRVQLVRRRRSHEPAPTP
jgi:hypothetical protein